VDAPLRSLLGWLTGTAGGAFLGVAAGLRARALIFGSEAESG